MQAAMQKWEEEEDASFFVLVNKTWKFLFRYMITKNGKKKFAKKKKRKNDDWAAIFAAGNHPRVIEVAAAAAIPDSKEILNSFFQSLREERESA